MSSLNIARITEMTHNQALESQALESRKWALVVNFIQEQTKALGYAGPLRDSDMRIALAVKAAIERLDGPEVESIDEHAPLAATGGPTPLEIEKVLNILTNELDDAVRATEPSAAASAPVEPASPPKTPKPAQAKA